MKKRIMSVVCELLMLLVTFLFFSPLLIMVFGAFKDSAGAAMFDFSIPTTWHFENFSFVIENGNILRSFKNSIVLTGFSSAAGVFVAAMAAFILARRKTKGSERLYNYFLVGIVALVTDHHNLCGAYGFAFKRYICRIDICLYCYQSSV